MRVTNKMLSNSFLSDLRLNLENMQKVQGQMTSGKEIRRPSDDPFKVARAMQLHSQINANKQYNENIKDTINWLDTTDTAIGQATDVLQRIRELLISAGDAAYGSGERKAIKDEINEKIGEFVQTMNTNFDGSYIFGGTRATTKPLDTELVGDNMAIAFYKKGGGKLPEEFKTKVDVKNINSNWADKTIDFNLNGESNFISIGSSSILGNNIDNLIDDLNNKISSNMNLKGKVAAIKTVENGATYISFTSLSNDEIKVFPHGNTSLYPFPPEIDNLKGALLLDNQLDMIGSKLSVEISTGVTMEYNVNAKEVIEFKNESGTLSSIKELFNSIVNHLDGKNYNSSNIKYTNDKRYQDDLDTGDATSFLAGKDLQGITDAINNLLKIRSEVGAKQNRMDSAKNQNEEENFNIKEILAYTEDIDITEKTMEYAVLQTVYIAALQTSAKVLQPSLLDYLR